VRRSEERSDSGISPTTITNDLLLAHHRWELLISIADVSSIFDFSSLSTAASTRCMSRYDLPLGPLHLMPPTALAALSFGRGTTDAVSVVVYIDEKSGNIIDCSVEQTGEIGRGAKDGRSVATTVYCIAL